MFFKLLLIKLLATLVADDIEAFVDLAVIAIDVFTCFETLEIAVLGAVAFFALDFLGIHVQTHPSPAYSLIHIA